MSMFSQVLNQRSKDAPAASTDPVIDQTAASQAATESLDVDGNVTGATNDGGAEPVDGGTAIVEATPATEALTPEVIPEAPADTQTDVTAVESLEPTPPAPLEEAPASTDAVVEPVAVESLEPTPEVTTQEALGLIEPTPDASAVESLTDPLVNAIEEPLEVVAEEPAVESLEVVPEAQPVAEEAPVATESLEPTPGIVRTPRSKVTGVIAQIEQLRQYDRKVQEVKSGLHDLKMIDQFQTVALEHQFSAPLVAAFRATPGFDQTMKNFPKTSLFNIIPEAKSSVNNRLGLESFNESQSEMTSDVAERAQAMCGSFKNVLATVGTTIINLQAQVQDDRTSLEASDVTDEVLMSLPVNTMSHMAFTEVLGKLDTHLRSIGAFSADDLRAYPNKIKDEVESLQALVAELGPVLGMGLDEYGLTDADKDAAYEPTPSSFGDKEITKTGLLFYLGQADSILEALTSLVSRNDELSSAVDEASVNMPSSVNSDDVTYGCVDHVTFLSCYTTLVTKLIRESIVAVTMLLSTIDAVLDVDDGLDDVD